MLWVKAVICALLLPSFYAAVSTKQQHTQREVREGTNPNIYLLGYYEGGKIFEYHDKPITAILFQPWNAPQTFESTIVFCDDDSAAFRGKSGLLVLAYSREMTQAYCYDLLGVFSAQQ